MSSTGENSGNDYQEIAISVRIKRDVVDILDGVIMPQISGAYGVELTRSDIIRMAINRFITHTMEA